MAVSGSQLIGTSKSRLNYFNHCQMDDDDEIYTDIRGSQGMTPKYFDYDRVQP